MLGDTVVIGINSRTFDLARIEASVDEETCIQDRVPEEAEGWTCLCKGKNSVPYIVTSKLQTRQLDVTKMMGPALSVDARRELDASSGSCALA